MGAVLNEGSREMDDLEQMAFENMARLYPHEIYALRPDEFWEFYQRQFPSTSREDMERQLADVSDYAADLVTA